MGISRRKRDSLSSLQSPSPNSRRIRHDSDSLYECDENNKISDDIIVEYLAKKAQKKAVKVAKKLKVCGYVDECNPFGDTNINEKFVWRKKIERDVKGGVPLEKFSVKEEKKRLRERMEEIEEVKKRREERAIGRARREEEIALLARDRARAEFEDWEKKEKEFGFQQMKAKSEIRLREGRVKAIDVLCKYVGDSFGDFDVQLNEPYAVFRGLTVKDMEELCEEIKVHLEFDRAHVEYWEALLVVCDWELAEALKKDQLERARVRGEQLCFEERGLHSSVEAHVESLLQGETYGELEDLESLCESKMRSDKAYEVEYWEAILKRLPIYKAKACLKEFHAKILCRNLERLEQSRKSEHMVEMSEAEDTGHYANHIQSEVLDEQMEEIGSHSPHLVHGAENEEAIDPEEDMALLETKRVAILENQQRRIHESSRAIPSDNYSLEAAMVAMGSMIDGDSEFGESEEVSMLDSDQVYWWHDKYRPRKPKYFNRVHSGYEWNKYNQTHYDHDHPPPKTVQGYKFNIFYPDLVDKTKAPEYTTEKDGISAETCILRFHAGPPYEDIAFRILNSEWECSRKKGFKCTFERGILHLYFNFKRHRYRR